MCPAQPSALWQLRQAVLCAGSSRSSSTGTGMSLHSTLGRRGEHKPPSRCWHSCRSEGRLAPGPFPSDPSDPSRSAWCRDPVEVGKWSFGGLIFSTGRRTAWSGHRKPQSQSCCGNSTGMDPLYQDCRAQNPRLLWAGRDFRAHPTPAPAVDRDTCH